MASQTKQKQLTVVPSWDQALMHSPKNNKPLNNEYNHLIYLTRHPDLKGRIQFDEFEQKIFITDTLPFTDKSRNFTVWTDADDVNLTAFLQMEGWPCNLNRLKACVEAAAREYKYHPVRSYLNGIEWDGESRTTNFLSRYFGCKPTDYVNAIGVRWMVSAVKRIFEPGCQSDYMLVLEGLQGKRKSTALRVLGGEWFTDEIPGNLSSKDAAESLQGVWIVEMSELHTLSKAEAEEAKQFISRRKDRFRGAFKRRTEDFPRQCIFAGTTNQDVYMKDETGARRFWPFKCVDIKLDELIRDRDQIWAECVQLYRAGHSVYLETDVLEDLARSEQSGRFISDAWHDTVYNFVSARSRVSMDEILKHMKIPTEFRNHSHTSRVGKIMRSLGYSQKRTRSEGRVYTKMSDHKDGF